MILALDISTSCTGWCVFDENGYRDIGFLENFQWYGATAQFTLYFKNFRT